MSRMGDLYGRKMMFVLGFSITSASLGLASIAADPVQLIAFRMLQGLGAGMTFGMIPALIVDTAPKRYRGRALGISNSGIALGLFSFAFHFSSFHSYLSGLLRQPFCLLHFFFLGDGFDHCLLYNIMNLHP